MTGRSIRFTVVNSQIHILKKTDLTGFFIIKPRQSDAIEKKQVWMKKALMGALIGWIYSKHVGCFLCLLNRTDCYV